MSYEKQIWENGVTPINAERLNHIEEGIAGVDTAKLDKMVVSKSLNTAGWYRVAKYNNKGDNSIAFILNVNSRYSNSSNQSVSVNVNIAHNKAKLTNIGAIISYNTISKVRAVQENNTTFIEIYYNVNLSNPVVIDIINQNGWDGSVITMLNFEAPTSTATVLDELSIGEFTTGVEYATNEFLDGKRIYKKRIKTEKLANTGAITVDTGVTNANYLYWDGLVKESESSIWIYKTNAGTGEYSVSLGFANNKFTVTTYGSSFTNYHGYITFYYTKN